MNIPSLQWEEAAVLPHARIIDVRSPSEYEQDHRPGAENVPLFEDDQRKVVGFSPVLNTTAEPLRDCSEIGSTDTTQEQD